GQFALTRGGEGLLGRPRLLGGQLGGRGDEGAHLLIQCRHALARVRERLSGRDLPASDRTGQFTCGEFVQFSHASTLGRFCLSSGLGSGRILRARRRLLRIVRGSLPVVRGLVGVVRGLVGVVRGLV